MPCTPCARSFASFRRFLDDLANEPLSPMMQGRRQALLMILDATGEMIVEREIAGLTGRDKYKENP